MSQKVLSVKVDPEDWEWFKEVSRAYRTQAEAFKALKQVYQTTVEKPVKVFTGNEIYQSVCVYVRGQATASVGTKISHRGNHQK